MSRSENFPAPKPSINTVNYFSLNKVQCTGVIQMFMGVAMLAVMAMIVLATMAVTVLAAMAVTVLASMRMAVPAVV